MEVNIRAFELPSSQYGYWLPIYIDCDEKTVRKLVLRAFRDMVIHFKYWDNWNLLRVKNFQIVYHKPGKCAGSMDGSYGWKCDIRFSRTVEQ